MSDAVIQAKQQVCAPFLAGRQSIWTGENPIIADGELLDLGHKVVEESNRALSTILAAMKAPAEYVTRDLLDTERELEAALRHVRELRRRVTNAQMPVSA